MRLSSPKLQTLQSEDGLASLTFITVNTNRDTGGTGYKFVTQTTGGPIHVDATVATLTIFDAARKFKQQRGEPLTNLRTSEMNEYILRYSEEYGNTYEVRYFKIDENVDDSTFMALRDKFCALFLQLVASRKYNSVDLKEDSDGYYPDVVHFRPENVNKDLFIAVDATKGGRNGRHT